MAELKFLARHAIEGGECECADMLMAGAYGGWYCPKHGFTDEPPPQYVIDAVRRLNDQKRELENWKYAREKADAASKDGLCRSCGYEFHCRKHNRCERSMEPLPVGVTEVHHHTNTPSPTHGKEDT